MVQTVPRHRATQRTHGVRAFRLDKSQHSSRAPQTHSRFSRAPGSHLRETAPSQDARPLTGYGARAQGEGRQEKDAGKAQSLHGESSAPSRSERAALIAARQSVSRYQMVGVGIVGAILAVGCIFGGLFFLRPTVSEVEHRELTAFPQVDFASFMDGSYFSNVALWYADTYPLRDPLVGFDQAFEALYGFNSGPKMVGGNVVADELPVPADEPSAGTEAAPTSEEEASQEEVIQEERVVTPPDPGELQAEMQNQIMNGLYVDGGTAYSLYWFDDDATHAYANAINEAARRLEGTSQVYSLLAPTNAGVQLDEELHRSLGGTNQEQAIDYFYSLMADNVVGVPTYEPLHDHKDEYIYFRTDHHWTQLGAYYAYQAFCNEKGIEPEDISTMDERVTEGFLGTFYSELMDPTLAENPDTVHAAIPHDTNDMTYWDEEGTEYQANVVNDLTGWANNSFYSTFILGDEPLSRIDNPKIHDGSSVLLVKDSFGCAFAPFLVDHYETVYIIDFRAYDGNIVDFAKENDIDDVIFLNCLSLAGTFGTADTIMSKVQGE